MLSQGFGEKGSSPTPKKETLAILLDSTTPIKGPSGSKKAGKWTQEEDDLLRKYAMQYGERQWRKVSQKIQGRTSIQCLHRWTKILKPGLVKGPWTQEEDQKLISWVENNGPNKWSQAAKLIQGRSGKQCRERWFNNLSPEVKKGEWTPEEDELIFKLYQEYGSSWSQLAKYIPGRTENSIKNRFYSTLRRLATVKKRKNKELVFMQNNPIKDFEFQRDQFSEEKTSDSDNTFTFFDGTNSNSNLYHLLQEPTMPLYPEMMMAEDPSSRDASDNNEIYHPEGNIKSSQGPSIKQGPLDNKNQNTIENKGKPPRDENERDFANFDVLEDFELPSPLAFDFEPKHERGITLHISNNLENLEGVTFEPKQNSKGSSYDVYEHFPAINSPMKPTQASQVFPNPSVQFEVKTQKYPNQISGLKDSEDTQFKDRGLNGISNINTTDYTSEIMVEPSFNQNSSERMPGSILSIPQRIIEECLSQQVNGIQRVNNLTILLKSLTEYNIEGLYQTVREGHLDNTVLKELAVEIKRAITCATTVHYNYVKYLLSIVQDLPRENIEDINKRMEYLFSRLSALESLLINAREYVTKLESFSFCRSEIYSSHTFSNMFDHKEGYKLHQIPIKIVNHHADFEEITKKRVLG